MFYQRRGKVFQVNIYVKTAGCLSVCVFVPKDLTNSWTYGFPAVELFTGRGKVYNYLGEGALTLLPREIA